MMNLSKKQLLILLSAFILTFTFSISSALALENSPRSATPTAKRNVREEKVVKARNSVEARVRVFDKAIILADRLLDRLQIRIDKAKEAGKDVTEMDKLMADSNVKLSDAKDKLLDINTKKASVSSKAQFETVRVEFKTVKDNLRIVKQNAAKMISLLKSFNSATSQGKNL